MAKVILLNSSPRANSNTQDVLEVCAEEYVAQSSSKIIQDDSKKLRKMVLKLKSYP